MTRARRALITLGGTQEPIDDVRVIANRSTGRFGCAIAQQLAAQGVHVTLVMNASVRPFADRYPPSAHVLTYRSAAELSEQLDKALAVPMDLLFMAAAVSDYTTAKQEGKLSSRAEARTLTLTKNPKILATLRQRVGPKTKLIGFKLLSHVPEEQLVQVAEQQIQDNQLDLSVANDLQYLTHTHHPIRLVYPGGRFERFEGPRDQVAAELVAAALSLLPASSPTLPLQRAEQSRPLDGRVGYEAGRAMCLPDLKLHGAQQLAQAAALWRLDSHAPFCVEGSKGKQLWATPGWADRWAQAWAYLTARAQRLAPQHTELVPCFYTGRLVGAAAKTPQGTLVIASNEMSLRVWLTTLLRQAKPTRWLADPTDVDHWRAVGFTLEQARPLLIARPPWQRTDVGNAASLCLLEPRHRRILLGRRKRWPLGLWAFPGGRQDPGETLVETAYRETREETGADVNPLNTWPLQAHSDHWVVGASTWHIRCIVRITRRTLPVHETEELAPEWVALDDALRCKPLAPGTEALIRRLLLALPPAT